jgi:hypothetical protein
MSFSFVYFFFNFLKCCITLSLNRLILLFTTWRPRDSLFDFRVFVRVSKLYFPRIFCSSFKLIEHQTVRSSRVYCNVNDNLHVACESVSPPVVTFWIIVWQYGVRDKQRVFAVNTVRVYRRQWWLPESLFDKMAYAKKQLVFTVNTLILVCKKRSSCHKSWVLYITYQSSIISMFWLPRFPLRWL